MTKWILAAALVVVATGAQAQYYGGGNSSYGGYGSGSNSNSHERSGYTTQSGTYVAPSTATNPNNTQMDNYGSRGNYNPNSGTFGTRTPKY